MLRIKSQPYNSIWISADSQKELGETFIRFQEFYESPNKSFRNRPFTLGAVKQWYSQKYGYDCYSEYWVGFNFPSDVLKSFYNGLFDPLTDNEKRLLESLQYRYDKFYVIGAQNNSVLRHELSHAMYGFYPSYKNEIDYFIKQNHKKFQPIAKYILKKGYDISVLNDEIQAYVTDNDDEFITKKLDPILINGIHKIYRKHRKHDKKLG